MQVHKFLSGEARLSVARVIRRQRVQRGVVDHGEPLHKRRTGGIREFEAQSTPATRHRPRQRNILPQKRVDRLPGSDAFSRNLVVVQDSITIRTHAPLNGNRQRFNTLHPPACARDSPHRTARLQKTGKERPARIARFHREFSALHVQGPVLGIEATLDATPERTPPVSAQTKYDTTGSPDRPTDHTTLRQASPAPTRATARRVPPPASPATPPRLSHTVGYGKARSTRLNPEPPHTRHTRTPQEHRSSERNGVIARSHPQQARAAQTTQLLPRSLPE